MLGTYNNKYKNTYTYRYLKIYILDLVDWENNPNVNIMLSFSKQSSVIIEGQADTIRKQINDFLL